MIVHKSWGPPGWQHTGCQCLLWQTIPDICDRRPQPQPPPAPPRSKRSENQARDASRARRAAGAGCPGLQWPGRVSGGRGWDSDTERCYLGPDWESRAKSYVSSAKCVTQHTMHHPPTLATRGSKSPMSCSRRNDWKWCSFSFSRHETFSYTK